MRRAAPGIVLARVVQAQGSVYGVTHVARVSVLLAVVFPPANRAQSQGLRSFNRLKTAT